MREYLLVLIVAAATTYLLTPYARLLAIKVGAMAKVRDRDVHAFETPRFGGLAMYLGVLSALLIARHLPALSHVFHDSSELNAVAVAGGLICLLGLIDDKWEMDALTKFAGETVAAGVMVLMGVQLSYLPIPGGETIVLGQQLAVPLTVLLCVALMNAVNFVDGLDGLAAGVVAIAGASAFLYSYLLSHNYQLSNIAPSTLIAAVLVGTCLGFLPHNFSPARLFMGDSGSLLLGLMLAATMTSVTGQGVFYSDSATTGNISALPYFAPLLLLIAPIAVPFLDLALAVVRRTRAGRSPFSPDKLHLHHRLLEMGHSDVRAVLSLYALVAILGFGTVAFSFSQGLGLVLSAISLSIVILAIFVSMPHLRKRSERDAPSRP